MRLRAALLAMLVAASCTSAPDPVSEPSFPPPAEKEGPVASLAFVGSLAGEPGDRALLDGARLAVEEVNAGSLPLRLRLSVADDREEDAALRSLTEALPDAHAVLYAGPGSAVATARAGVEERGAPVVVLDGDLYTRRALFAEAFQAEIPMLWQARVIARYLAVRGEEGAAVVVGGPEAEAATAAWRAAAAEEGVQTVRESRVAEGRTVEPGVAVPGVPLVVLASAPAAKAVSTAVRNLRPRAQVVASHELIAGGVANADLPPGTAAVAPYTWSGWAEPIPRVEGFRERFRRAYGRLPLADEQHGYDAVRVLADALAATGGETGPPLLEELERVRGRAYSSLPLRFGADDRLFYDEYQLGVFAVPGPEEDAEPWIVPEAPWRPVMRTFTSDGERTTILERDRGPFFPNWKKPAPSPKYFWSRIGITTRPSDPLH